MLAEMSVIPREVGRAAETGAGVSGWAGGQGGGKDCLFRVLEQGCVCCRCTRARAWSQRPGPLPLAPATCRLPRAPLRPSAPRLPHLTPSGSALGMEGHKPILQ